MATSAEVKAVLDAGKVELEADLARIEASSKAAVDAINALRATFDGTTNDSIIVEINAVKDEAMARVGAAMDALDAAVTPPVTPPAP